jgi:hypothetical protein
MGYPQAGITAGEILREIDSTLDRLRFLLRIASYTNRTALAQKLNRAIASAETLEVKAAFYGKLGLGVARLAAAFEQSLPAGVRLRASILEAPAYRELAPEALLAARQADASVFLVPAAAPFFDDTVDFLAAEVPEPRRKRLIVIDSADAALAADLAIAVTGDPRLRDVTLCTEPQFIPALTAACLQDPAQAALQELRALVPIAARELKPAAAAFAAFLALPQPGYLRRIEYIRRDLDALSNISRRAHEFLSRQGEAALAHAGTAARGIVPAMRQQAEAVIQQSPLPRDATTAQARARFGQQTSVAARAAGYREFDERVRSAAMRLNSARSILLTTMEQFRAEAQPHMEELTANLGPDLYMVWMREAGFDWAERPLDLPLDPGVDFPDLILAAAARIRQAIPEQDFVASWQSRLDAMLRSDMTASATAGWTTFAVDQPLSGAIGGIWNENVERACGLLIGRLDAFVNVVKAALASSRIGSLRCPADPGLRRQTAGLYRGFADAISSEIPA